MIELIIKDKRNTNKINQKGFAIFEIIFAFAMFSALLLFMLNIATLVNEQNELPKIQNTRQKLYIIANILKARVADPDNDGMWEPLSADANETLPRDVPFRVDEWGTLIKYCAWDLGNATHNNTNYTRNRSTPPKSNMIMKLISAGRDKNFNTRCNDNTTYGDDIVVEVFHEELICNRLNN